MIPKSLRWRLPLSYAGIALLTTVSLGAVLLLMLQQFYRQQELDYLLGNARTISQQIAPLLENGDLNQLPAQVKGLAFLSQTQVEVLSADKGRLLANSGDPRLADANSQISVAVEVDGVEQVFSQSNQGDGVEITSESIIVIEQGPLVEEVIIEEVETNAEGEIVTTRVVERTVETTIGGGFGSQDEEVLQANGRLPVSGTQFGFGLGANAVPSEERSDLVVSTEIKGADGQTLGFVQLSEGPAYGRTILQTVFVGWVLASLVAVMVAGTVGWFASRRLTRPLQALTDVTQRMSGGDLSARADVSRGDELGKLAVSFDQMADQVEETIVTLRQFVADAAHELHTPLTALQTDLDLVAQSHQDEANATRLARAQAQAKRLQSLTDNLLDLSRLEAGKALELEPLRLNDVLLSVSEMFASRAEQAEIEYVVAVTEADVRVLGDYGRLQQAISNLLDNAIKFTPAGGTVSLALSQENNEAVITITDTGIGIPEEDVPFLFGRFHRGRNTQAYPGNGLGLAIVKAIVDGCNGRIAVASSDSGTRISLKFPLLANEVGSKK